MAKRVLIIDEVHPSLAIDLAELGFIVDIQTHVAPTDLQLQGYEGIILRSKIALTAARLAEAKDLQFIARAGAGLDLIDLAYCEANHIAVFSANEGNRDAVAEHVIGQLLSIAHKLNQADQQVRAGIWDREGNRGWELAGKTIGIIGFGNMGKALAKKLQGFDMRIIAYDKYVAPYHENLPSIFAEADIISLHVSLTDETRNLVDASFLASCKKPIVLINSSRGSVCDLYALADGIKGGKIKGLALDVLPNEKIKSWTADEKNTFDTLSALSASIFSPHVAGWTTESYRKINDVIIQKIKAHFQL